MQFLCVFWVSYEELPGGACFAAMRRKLINTVLWVLMNGLAVMNTRQAARANFASILMILGFFGWILNGKREFTSVG